MKKQFNVNGTKFTVNVDVETESYYDTIQEDYKKILYLLGEASKIGAKLDFEFTTRNTNLDWQENVIQERKEFGLSSDIVPDRPQVAAGITKRLELTNRQKEEILTTIVVTMSWYRDLRSAIESL